MRQAWAAYAPPGQVEGDHSEALQRVDQPQSSNKARGEAWERSPGWVQQAREGPCGMMRGPGLFL